MATGASSLPALVAANATASPAGVVLRRKDRGIWKAMTWAELAQRMRRVAAAIAAAGVERGAGIGILSETRIDWGVLDLGIQAAGSVAIGFNPAEPPAVLARQLVETGCALLFVENAALLDAVLQARARAPALGRIVIIDMKGLRDFADPQCISLEAFLAGARGDATGGDVDSMLAGLTPTGPAALIYTSGTTGDARPLLFTHANLMAAGDAGRALDMRPGDERLAFLPMCHAVERVLGFYLALRTGAISNYVESADTVPENLSELQPTVLVAPPRFWRRLHARARAAEAQASSLQRWALGRAISGGGMPGASMALRALRRSLGLDRVRRAVVAFGALPADVAAWFSAVGAPVVELYGTTEGGGLGFAVPNAGGDVRLSATGEIELRGAHLAAGYWQGDGTLRWLAPDGWFATGDLALAEVAGLRPIGRAQPGVAAAGIETALRASPFIADAIALAASDRAGDGVHCLIMLEPATVEPWAQRANVPFTGFASLARAEPVRGLIAEAVAGVNAARGAGAEIKAFRLLEQRFEPGDAELSPLFQLRRAAVCARYRAAIDDMQREA